MRVSKSGLLIVLAFSVPVLIELRTVLGMVGVTVPMDAYLAVVALVFAAIVGGWAIQRPQVTQVDG